MKNINLKLLRIIGLFLIVGGFTMGFIYWASYKTPEQIIQDNIKKLDSVKQDKLSELSGIVTSLNQQITEKETEIKLLKVEYNKQKICYDRIVSSLGTIEPLKGCDEYTGKYFVPTLGYTDRVRAFDEITPDNELTNSKPNNRRRLDSNGFAQRYIGLSGNSTEERSKSLLAHYGLYNYGTRDRLSKDAGVKTEFAICVSRAETSLGLNNKSQNNRFNCGNNDRGNTIDTDSFEHGFHIFDVSCINGTYLKDKKTIADLNPQHKDIGCTVNCGKSYATSKESWSDNVLNCLGMIYNDSNIQPSFNFRLK